MFSRDDEFLDKEESSGKGDDSNNISPAPEFQSFLSSFTTNTRRLREFIPEHKKDKGYWLKRQKNNEAAKRSREKRRMNDFVLSHQIIQLTSENRRLKLELQALKRRFGVSKSSQNDCVEVSFLSNEGSDEKNNHSDVFFSALPLMNDLNGGLIRNFPQVLSPNGQQESLNADGRISKDHFECSQPNALLLNDTKCLEISTQEKSLSHSSFSIPPSALTKERTKNCLKEFSDISRNSRYYGMANSNNFIHNNSSRPIEDFKLSFLNSLPDVTQKRCSKRDSKTSLVAGRELPVNLSGKYAREVRHEQKGQLEPTKTVNDEKGRNNLPPLLFISNCHKPSRLGCCGAAASRSLDVEKTCISDMESSMRNLRGVPVKVWHKFSYHSNKQLHCE